MATIVDKREAAPKDILIVCDFSPPRSTDPETLNQAKELTADFISVAYNPGKSIRVNSTLGALWIKNNTSKNVIFTLATRDMNKIAIQSLLLGANINGLENVVIVKGDSFNTRELRTVTTVDDFRPTELIESLSEMNKGLDYKGNKLHTPTHLCIGATIDLANGLERELKLTRRKIEAGVQFFLMQPVFEPNLVIDFMDTYHQSYGETISNPIFCGIQVMVPEGIVFSNIPAWVKADLDKGRPGYEIASQILENFVGTGLRSIYLVPPILPGGHRDYEAAQRVIDTVRN